MMKKSPIINIAFRNDMKYIQAKIKMDLLARGSDNIFVSRQQARHQKLYRKMNYEE